MCDKMEASAPIGILKRDTFTLYKHTIPELYIICTFITGKENARIKFSNT